MAQTETSAVQERKTSTTGQLKREAMLKSRVLHSASRQTGRLATKFAAAAKKGR